jgi:restriction endonuclease S subunit
MLQVREEVYFTKGRIIVRGKLVTRGKAKKADVVLYYKPNIPIALIEAKDNNHSVGDGIQQGLDYAETLKIPFVFSSNGDGFLFHDRTSTGGIKEANLGLDDFPSPADLWARYCAWKGIDTAAEQIVLQDYYDDGSGEQKRYYQVNAINAAIEAIAKGQDRVLIVMATGSGKTRTAFQIIWRLWKAGRKKRILFLADRNVLIDQTMMNDFRPFGPVMAKLSTNAKTIERQDGTKVDLTLALDKKRRIDTAFEVYLGLYQAITGPEEHQKLYKEFSKEFFDLMGRCAIVTDREAGWLCGTGSLILRPSRLIYAPFLALLIGSPFGREYLGGSAVGSTMQNLNQSILLNLPFGLPPVAEQHRIVAKVDDLMGLCDRLEAARASREAVRDRLAMASLAHLNAPNHETFQADVRFALDALPAITTRPDQIKQLRQTILNLAVRGKLVPQNPKDEPASELLKRIAKEKALTRKSASEGSIVVPSESDGYDSQIELPVGWVWATLGEITQIGTGLTPSKVQLGYYEGGDIPWINSSATSANVIREAKFFVTRFAVKECRLKIFPAGSLVVALYGQGKTRGQVAELGFDATVNQACAVVQWLPSFHDIKEFVRLTLAQQYDAMRERSEGGPQPNLNVGKIKDRLLPLPPLAEQHRIVDKVDALMALCDRLEASLTATAATRRRLLDALLAEALTPTTTREMEAAE